MTQIYDIQRLLGPRDDRPGHPARSCRSSAARLPCLPKVKAKLTGRTQRAAAANSKQRLDLCADIRGPLEQALVDDCPLTARDGSFIRAGYRADLDELRELMAGGKQWMAEYQAAECQRTGIASMKVGFNSVFGYYLEVTHTHREKVPAELHPQANAQERRALHHAASSRNTKRKFSRPRTS